MRSMHSVGWPRSAFISCSRCSLLRPGYSGVPSVPEIEGLVRSGRLLSPAAALFRARWIREVRSPFRSLGLVDWRITNGAVIICLTVLPLCNSENGR